VGTYSAWESTDTLRLLGGERGAWAPTGAGEGRGHSVSPRAQFVIITITIIIMQIKNTPCVSHEGEPQT